MFTVHSRLKSNHRTIKNSVLERQSWKDFKNSLINKRLILYGAGRTCGEFLQEYAREVKAEFIVDQNPAKREKTITGIKVCPVEDAWNMASDTLVVLITSVEFDEEIYGYLTNKGFSDVFSVYAVVVNGGMSIRKRLYNYFFEYHFGLFSDHNLLYNYIVFHIQACMRILHIPLEYNKYKRIEEFKKKHDGQRCFIVATGPSLQLNDIENLWHNGEITFGMNTIMQIFDKTEWRPDYYVLQDPKYVDEVDWDSPRFNMDNMCKEAFFLTNMYREKARNFKKAFYYPISFLDHLQRFDATSLAYSDNLLWGIYCTYTVTTVCMQLAYYMGFAEIYLLGVDCNYDGEKKHFIKQKDDDKRYTKEKAKEVYKIQQRGYQYIGEQLEKRRKRI